MPIIHQRHVLGVLIVHQHASRCFDESEEAFLITLSAQLAGTIAYAVAVGAIQEFNKRHGTPSQDTTLSGIPGSPGVSIGYSSGSVSTG